MGACAAVKQRRVEGNIIIAPFRVSVTAFVWNKESHNLFDFENNQSTKKELDVDFSATLSIVDNHLIALGENEYVKKQTQVIKVECGDDHVMLQSVNAKTDQRIWAILRSNNEFESLTEWELQKSDVVKLGRMKLQLLDFNHQHYPPIQQTEADEEPPSPEQKEHQCRICFSSRSSTLNPLFSPCKCIGSMKYIHLKCLQIWIHQSIKIKQGDGFTQYIWKSMECEVCKMHLKSTYTFHGNIFCIMSIPKPIVPYMMWKITSDEKSKEGIMHVMELRDKTEIKIGRIPECDVKLKDISVSRSHASIKIVRQEDSIKLIISDNNSKFGTLLLAKDDKLLRHQVGQQMRVLYQIGRVLLYFQLKEKGKNYNKQFTCYKHPPSIQINSRLPLNEQATINPNAECQVNQSQTHNELNSDEILMSMKDIQNI